MLVSIRPGAMNTFFQASCHESCPACSSTHRPYSCFCCRQSTEVEFLNTACCSNHSAGGSTYHGGQNDYQNNSKIILFCNRTNKQFPGRKSCSGLVTSNFENSKLFEGLVILNRKKKEPHNHTHKFHFDLLLSFLSSCLAWCRCTRGRFESTHGSFLDGYTGRGEGRGVTVRSAHRNLHLGSSRASERFTQRTLGSYTFSV